MKTTITAISITDENEQEVLVDGWEDFNYISVKGDRLNCAKDTIGEVINRVFHYDDASEHLTALLSVQMKS